MKWASLALYCAGLLGAGLASAAQIPPPPVSGTYFDAQGRCGLPPEAILALGSAKARMTVPVRIAGKGPYPFIIDTGAERTVISRQLASVLGLSAGPNVVVAAISGRAPVGTYVIPRLSMKAFPDLRNIAAPALSSYDMGAHGLIGLDMLAGHAVVIDFKHDRMSVRRSVRRASRDEIVVIAERVHGALLMTDAFYGGKRIRVMVDTGTTVSVGNAALKQLVAANTDSAGLMHLTSVTGVEQVTDYAEVDGVAVGGVTFSNLPIVFLGPSPFREFDFGDGPMLLLGMSALRAFSGVVIDFAHKEVRFEPPRGGIYVTLRS